MSGRYTLRGLCLVTWRNRKNLSMPPALMRLKACNPLAACVMLMILWGQLRSSIGTRTRVAELSLNTPPNVYLCGYKFWRLCEAVFPEYNCRRSEGSTFSKADILVIGMHAQCELENTFPGTILYINGEPFVSRRAKKSFYLGPAINGESNSMQFHFVSLAALQIPEAFSSFTQRRKNSGKEFLLYVSRRCLQHREKAFHMLSSIDTVTSGGRCDGTTLRGVSFAPDKFKTLSGAGPWSEAHTLYADFKFGLVMENTKQRGYISEKILNAFIGGTIPIYYGTEDVFTIFNRDAFVFFNEDQPQETLETVRALLVDDDKYNAMLAQPILAKGAFDEYFAMYGKGKLSRKIREFIGISGQLAEEDD